MPIIERERFEAWLFARPDNETFNYYNSRSCLTARYLKDQHPQIDWAIGHDMYVQKSLGVFDVIPIPEWLRKVLHHPRICTLGLNAAGCPEQDCPPITMAIAKAVYIEVHGDPSKVKGETHANTASQCVPA